MSTPRIAVLNIGHPDYPNEVGQHFAREAACQLAALGVEIVANDTACTCPIEAVSRGQELAAAGVDGVILWLGTWIECSTAVAALREFEHLPFILWGFNMYEENRRSESTGSFVAAAVLKGSLERMGYNFKTIFGLPSDDATIQQALTFCRCASAYQNLKRTRLGLVGYASMSMYPGTFDHALMRRIIGPEVIQIDNYTLINQAEAADIETVQRINDEISSVCKIQVAPERLEKSARLAAGFEAIIQREYLHGINAKCQYELSQEYGMTACIPLSWLADKGIVTACEGDVPLSVTMLMLDRITENVVTYGDILDLDNDVMLLSSCGMAPMSQAHPGDGPEAKELDYPGFDGVICSCTLRRGPVTFARLVEGRGDYRILYGTGEGIDSERRQGRFPALRVRLDGDPATLLETLASQHFALTWGDLSPEIKELTRILNIEAQRI